MRKHMEKHSLGLSWRIGDAETICRIPPATTCISAQLLSKTSQELQMLSSVTINCQETKIVMNSGSQLSEL